MLYRGDLQRILAYRLPVDMRKSIDGLLGLVKGALAEDPLTGTLYVFVNRRNNLMKSVYWDRTGFCLFAKRLEQGRFHLPGKEVKQELNARAFELLLDGIMLGPRKRSAVQTGYDTARASRIAKP